MISVVCVYDNEEYLKRILLKSLQSQTVEFELITLDNRDGRFKSAAEALNYGGEKANGDYIMFVHQDMCLLSDSFIEDAERILRSIPDLGVGGVGGATNEGKWRYSIDIYDSPDYCNLTIRKPEVVETLDECLLLVPRPVFDKLKFDEKVFDGWDCYGADYSLCVARLGLKAYVIPGSSAHTYTRRGFYHIWDFNNLLKYEKRLYAKHKGDYKTIHTWLAKVSWLRLRQRELQQLFGPVYLRLFPDLSMILSRELSECRSVLELGCGHRSLLHLCNVPFSVGVESREPYLQETIRRGIHSQYIRAEVARVEFAPKSFDAVIGLNFSDHVAGPEAVKLIGKMEQWARKKVIITTPNIYLRSVTDARSKIQQHWLKSGSHIKSLRALGFEVHGLGSIGIFGPFPRLFKAISIIIPLFYILFYTIAYYYPRTAFQLIAIKSTYKGR